MKLQFLNIVEKDNYFHFIIQILNNRAQKIQPQTT